MKKILLVSLCLIIFLTGCTSNPPAQAQSYINEDLIEEEVLNESEYIDKINVNFHGIYFSDTKNNNIPGNTILSHSKSDTLVFTTQNGYLLSNYLESIDLVKKTDGSEEILSINYSGYKYNFDDILFFITCEKEIANLDELFLRFKINSMHQENVFDIDIKIPKEIIGPEIKGEYVKIGDFFNVNDNGYWYKLSKSPTMVLNSEERTLSKSYKFISFGNDNLDFSKFKLVDKDSYEEVNLLYTINGSFNSQKYSGEPNYFGEKIISITIYFDNDITSEDLAKTEEYFNHIYLNYLDKYILLNE